MNFKNTEGGQFLTGIWELTQSYWCSEEKKKAFFLLFAIICLTIASVYMMVLLNEWNNSFYSALQNYEKNEVFKQLLRFCGLAFLFIIFGVYSFYLQFVLIINWRKWLTNKYIEAWLENKTYYRMQIFGKDMDNPDQRISEDVKLFVQYTLEFGIGILRAVLVLASFVIILFRLSGPLEFTAAGINWNIPGYLVWMAVLYSAGGTYLTYKVGHKLVQMNFIQQKYEADFRFSMMRMRENAESVAFYNGEKHEEVVFKDRFKTLLDNFWLIIKKRKDLVWLNNWYTQIAIIFPLVVCMPRFLDKEITLGGLMQVASAFTRVQSSLSFFVDTYAIIAQWQSVVARLTQFSRRMKLAHEANAQENLEKSLSENDIIAREITLSLPDGEILLNKVDFTLEHGKNVLIKGVSGSGKSTTLRAMAGLWPYVEGFLTMPKKENQMFIPQKPYLPLGTLRDALLYPGLIRLSDEELKKIMDDCSIGYLYEKLNVEADWSHMLSIGEQQRLAFVRALIYKPQWLFLDEASAALDEATEDKVYRLLKATAPQTTLVSVGHRSTLNKFHETVLYIDKKEKSMTVKHDNKA